MKIGMFQKHIGYILRQAVCFIWNQILIWQIHVKIHKYFKNALTISMRYWNISIFDIKCSMRFWNIWIMIFENISENALSNIIGQCAQCVQCVIEITPVSQVAYVAVWDLNLPLFYFQDTALHQSYHDVLVNHFY